MKKIKDMNDSTDKKMRLDKTKTEVKDKLQKQIDKGEEILKCQINDKNDLQSADKEEQLWYEYTKELLLHLFVGDQIEDEFKWEVRVFSPGEDGLHDRLNQRITKLRSIMQRVDLAEEPKGLNSEVQGEISKSVNIKNVFVVHGRNQALTDSMFDFLRAIGLEPIEWNKAIALTRKPTPYIQDIISTAFKEAQAVLVLLSGDDLAVLRGKFIGEKDGEHERKLTPQARPNVLFEAGMAMAGSQQRTILVQVGILRPFSDIQGLHITSLDNSPEKRQELSTKLKNAGCDIGDILSNQRWMKVGNFEDPIDNNQDHTGKTKPVTDLSYSQNEKSLANDKFLKLEQTMPDLLDEMRKDSTEYPLTREFVLLKKTWGFNQQSNVFKYYFEDHPDLIDKIHILENHGLIRNVTSSNVERYRISEEFAGYLGHK
jgi:predicted nucleotide-binding protein